MIVDYMLNRKLCEKLLSTIKMKIRDVKQSDLEHLASLSCFVSKMHADAHPEIYKSFSHGTALKILEHKTNDDNSIFRVAENETIPVGYYIAGLRAIEENDYIKAYSSIYLAEIVVSPDSQGSGIGKALLKDLKIIASEKNIQLIDLDVGEFNANTFRFFKSQGFNIMRNRMSLKTTK